MQVAQSIQRRSQLAEDELLCAARPRQRHRDQPRDLVKSSLELVWLSLPTTEERPCALRSLFIRVTSPQIRGPRSCTDSVVGATAAITVLTTSSFDAPGPSTAATPDAKRMEMSVGGTMPPMMTGVSRPASLRDSTTAGAKVRWAPLCMDTPTRSTSSAIDVAVIMSVDCRSPA